MQCFFLLLDFTDWKDSDSGVSQFSRFYAVISRAPSTRTLVQKHVEWYMHAIPSHYCRNTTQVVLPKFAPLRSVGYVRNLVGVLTFCWGIDLFGTVCVPPIVVHQVGINWRHTYVASGTFVPLNSTLSHLDLFFFFAYEVTKSIKTAPTKSFC